MRLQLALALVCGASATPSQTPAPTPAVVPAPAPATEQAVDLANGRGFSFATQDGVAKATGRNNYGQLGLGDVENRGAFATVTVEGERIKTVAAGAFHTLFLTETGNVYVAGRNHRGQLGVPDLGLDQIVETPRKLEAFTGASGIAAGYAHSLVLVGSEVQAVGQNTAGQLGDGTNTSRNTWTVVPDMFDGEGPIVSPKTSAIAAGYDFSYFLNSKGDVWGVGQNLGGQLGDGSMKPQSSPKKATTLVDIKVIAMSAGESHGVFLTERAGLYSVFATGSNAMGQGGQDGASGPLSNPTWIKDSEVPGKVSGRVQPGRVHETTIKVAAGGDTTCIIGQYEDDLLCFGSNIDGQCGAGRTPKTVETTRGVRNSNEIKNFKDFKYVALGDAHTVAVAYDFNSTNGRVIVMGDNTHGELGVAPLTPEFNARENDDFTFQLPATTPRPPAPTPAPRDDGPRNPTSPDDDPSPAIYIVVGIAVVAALAGVGFILLKRRKPAESHVEEDFGEDDSGDMAETTNDKSGVEMQDKGSKRGSKRGSAPQETGMAAAASSPAEEAQEDAQAEKSQPKGRSSQKAERVESEKQQKVESEKPPPRKEQEPEEKVEEEAPKKKEPEDPDLADLEAAMLADL